MHTFLFRCLIVQGGCSITGENDGGRRMDFLKKILGVACFLSQMVYASTEENPKRFFRRRSTHNDSVQIVEGVFIKKPLRRQKRCSDFKALLNLQLNQGEIESGI
ncbi:hypothetical protein OAN21_01930 [Alphaproteobacteria bacterium]|nr:hypothetical protein [Alphaproteobacteria bacterium]